MEEIQVFFHLNVYLKIKSYTRKTFIIWFTIYEITMDLRMRYKTIWNILLICSKNFTWLIIHKLNQLNFLKPDRQQFF